MLIKENKKTFKKTLFQKFSDKEQFPQSTWVSESVNIQKKLL